jgi:hypothetical protein
VNNQIPLIPNHLKEDLLPSLFFKLINYVRNVSTAYNFMKKIEQLSIKLNSLTNSHLTSEDLVYDDEDN